jgi:hypothetical protein
MSRLWANFNTTSGLEVSCFLHPRNIAEVRYIKNQINIARFVMAHNLCIVLVRIPCERHLSNCVSTFFLLACPAPFCSTFLIAALKDRLPAFMLCEDKP